MKWENNELLENISQMKQEVTSFDQMNKLLQSDNEQLQTRVKELDTNLALKETLMVNLVSSHQSELKLINQGRHSD